MFWKVKIVINTKGKFDVCLQAQDVNYGKSSHREAVSDTPIDLDY